jgi:tRNA-specific 2-thiouridylase
MARVVLAMSGGVDSSVAAHLLKAAGHDVIGVFMRHGEPPAAACSTERPQYARRVADRLDIPFYAIDFQEDFGRIIDYFVDEYTAARTPNPCVMCNNWIKFGRLFDYADSVGAEFVATGHYARLETADDGQPALLRGIDTGKDQSYVLFGIERALLPRMLLPVGTFEKPEIRRRAGEIGLAVAEKRDSQEICFVSSGDHAEFIRRRRPEVDLSGEVVTTTGQVVGTHDGLERFTIGQRRGLGIALGDPHFVVRLEPETNRVVLGTKDDLARTELTADRTNLLVDIPLNEPTRCTAKIRYNARPADGVVEQLAGERLRVTFDAPQYGIAPGQAVVCYDGERVLGGGWIE